MKILADKGIARVREAFGPHGDLRLCDGRHLTPAELGDAEVLLVRSVTRVDRELLAGSRVRFVGTATSGVDHVDIDYLATAGVAFADAAGCNARAVAEHVVTCLVLHAAASGRDYRTLTVGIVGCGHVGQALAALLQRLGVEHVLNDPLRFGDPPRAPRAVTLADALAADVVTLHVPLTAGGPHPTLRLIDADAIARMRPGALLVNAARGGVVDERALAERVREGPPLRAAIDCWAGEPALDRVMLREAWLASPHIAGHTLEARLAATVLLHTALARRYRPDATWRAPEPAPPPPLPGARELRGLLLGVHDLAAHTARLRRMLSLPAARHGAYFDSVRLAHGLRREFGAYDVACAGLAPDTVATLQALGFRCDDAARTRRAVNPTEA